MEEGILILVQPETTIVPTTTTPSLDATLEDLGVDVRVEETPLWKSSVKSVIMRMQSQLERGMMLKVDYIETDSLPIFYRNWFFTTKNFLANFFYQIYFTKNLFTKTNLICQFKLCIFRNDFFGMKLIACSTIFNIFFIGI